MDDACGPPWSGEGSLHASKTPLTCRRRTVGEYGSALHLATQQRGKDVRREGAFRRLGMEYVEMVTADLADPADFPRRTRDAVRRSHALDRRWTLEPPLGWVETHTVALRSALDDSQRDRLLRWQAG